VTLNVIHHLCWPGERLLHAVTKEDALSLLADKSNGLESRGLLLDEKRRGRGDAATVTGSHLTTAAESLHEVSGLDPTLHSVLQGYIRDESADEVSQLRPLGDLVLNQRLDVLFFLLCAIVPLNVFCRAAAEVVCAVFFGDDVSALTLSTIDGGSKLSHFFLYVCPLHSVCPSFEPLSSLLKVNNSWIGGERGQEVVRYMDRSGGIAIQAHMRQHAKDAVCGRTLEHGRQDVKPHPLIYVGPIIHGRVRIVPHNLVTNGISGSAYNKKSSVSNAISASRC
jgi:hypothetical protein